MLLCPPDHYQKEFINKSSLIEAQKAIAQQENILIYGDYDVDGTTAVALVSSYIMTYYPNVATYIPDRYSEGYGISYQGIDFAEDNDFSLIIALDCGIKAIKPLLLSLLRREQAVMFQLLKIIQSLRG